MTLKKIYWERVNLHLVLDEKIDGDVKLFNNKTEINLDVEYIDNEVVINVTNTLEGTMLDKGNYSLFVNGELVKASDEVLDILDDKSKIFRYRGNKCCYIVFFEIDEEMNFNIITNFMIENFKYKKFFTFSEGNGLKGKFIILIKLAYILFKNILYKFFRLFRLPFKKKVLFLTENSDTLISNLKLMYDYIDKKEYKVMVYSKDKFKAGSIQKLISLLTKIVMIAKSDIIFVDNYTPVLTSLNLSKKVELIQLWHAGVGFKSVGYARFGVKGSPHPYVSSHRKYTGAVVDKEGLEKVYMEVFGCKKDIFISTGMPRLDGYLSEDRIKKVTEKLYNLNSDLKEKKVILFAPTYRGVGSSVAYYDYNQLDLEKIYDYCISSNSLFVFKMHGFIKEPVEIDDKYKEVILDYSNMDINDLIYISDVMITDYSSCAYEYSLFDRPLIFYRYDKKIYEFFRPIHTASEFTSKQFEVLTFDELMKCLNDLEIDPKTRLDNISYKNNVNSCQKIVDKFIKKIDK